MKMNFLNTFGCCLAALVLGLFVGCGDDSPMASRENDCPEGYVCDTTYTDTTAYSFVYYSGKNKLDTVTALTGEMTCDIQDNYFSCLYKKTYKTCYVVSSTKTNAAERNTEGDSLIHKEVNLLRIDTTYINYGKRRLIDSIPPYIEPEKMDLKGLQDAFDTVELDLYDSSSYDRYEGHTDFSTTYVVYEDYGTLPRGAGSFTSKDYFKTIDADGDTIHHFYQIFIDLCNETIYIEYPLTPKIYEAQLYMFSHDPLEKDTTVTWMAYYTDMYGVRDSTEITTVFKMKEGFVRVDDSTTDDSTSEDSTSSDVLDSAMRNVPSITFCEDSVPKTCNFDIEDTVWMYCASTPKNVAGGIAAHYYYYTFDGKQLLKKTIEEGYNWESDQDDCEYQLSHGSHGENVFCKGPATVTVTIDTLDVADDEAKMVQYEKAKSHCEEIRERYDNMYKE